MQYKGYTGHVEYDTDARLFVGEVLNLRDVISFRGRTVDDLERSFQETIDFYLEVCQQRGETPEKPFNGKVSVRVSPELHRRAMAFAKQRKQSLNDVIASALERLLSQSV